MEKNIFEGAKFGDKFVMQNGKIAIYVGYLERTHRLIPAGEIDVMHWYHSDGTTDAINCEEYDIISRYQKPIDEKKLDELAGEYMVDKHFYLGTKFDYMDCRNAYKNGYRSAFNNKAKEE